MVKLNSEDAIYTYIFDKCNSRTPGFYPFEVPTGHGKTTAMVSAIIDSVRDPRNMDRKFFIATTKLANLDGPYKDLCEALGTSVVLRLKNIQDVSRDFLKAVNEKRVTVNELISGSEAYTDFDTAMKSLTSAESLQAKNKGDDIYDGIIKDLMDKVNAKYGDLRDYIIKVLNAGVIAEGMAKNPGFVTGSERKSYIESHIVDWKFLYELFPSMKIDRSRVILMSIDKMAWPIKSPTQNYKRHFYSELCAASGDFNTSVVFLDESDEAIRQLRGAIIDSATREDSDIIRMIRNVYTPRVAKRSDFEEKANVRTSELNGFYDDLRDQIFEKYNLGYTFRTSDEVRSGLNRRFLFRSEIEAKMNASDCLFVHFNGKENLIYNAPVINGRDGKIAGYDTKSPEDVKLSQVAFDVYYYLVFKVTNFVARLAGRYQSRHHIDFSDAVTTIMRMMEFNENTMSFIQDNMAPNTSREVNQKALRDGSFYENGTATSIILDAPSHNEDTELRFYVCSTTPEKIIADMSEQVQVWGISATALNESCIMNGNMRWIKTRLGDKFHEPTKEELDVIKEQDKKNWDFTGVTYHISQHWYEEQSPCKDRSIVDYTKRRTVKLFVGCSETKEDARTAAGYVDSITKAISNAAQACTDSKKSQRYIVNRYLTILNAWKIYITHTNVDSALFYGNKYIRTNELSLDLGLINTCRNLINTYYNYAEDLEGEFIQLTTDDLKDKDNTLLDALDSAFLAGKRRFVYTIYSATGTGLNLQHKFKSNESLVKVSLLRENEDRKDYDMIFLSNPTHVVENIFGDHKNCISNMLVLTYQCESLCDSYSGEITVSEAAKILEAKASNSIDSVKGLKGVESEVAGSTNIMTQAIGRIGRSPYRNKDVYIYLDPDAAKAFARASEDKHYFAEEVNRVFQSNTVIGIRNPLAISDLAQAAKNPDERAIENQNKAAYTTIMRCMKRDPEKGFLDIQGWNDIRKAVLLNITSEDDWKNLGHAGRIMYRQMNGLIIPDGNYSYSVKDDERHDYRNVSVSLDPLIPKKMVVSSESTRLADMLLIDGVREYFEDSGYRTDLAMENFILPPIALNNIFKGALSEEAGMFAINQDLQKRGYNVRLENIDNPFWFELFDAVFKQSNVYVDFKNYTEDTQAVTKDVIEGEHGGIDKAKEIGTKTIIYISMTSRNKYKPSDDLVDGIRVIQLPGLYTITNGIAIRNDQFFDILYEAIGIK